MDTKSTQGAALTDQERDPWLNPHLSPTGSKGALAIVGSVVLAVRGYKRGRKLKEKDRDTLSRVLHPLVANLIRHYLMGSPGTGFPVPRSHKGKALGGKGNRYQPFSFPRSFPKMLDALVGLGFVEQTIGDARKFKRTTIKAGPKLIELINEHRVALEDLSASDGEEIIILKRLRRGHWDGGAHQDYHDTATTERFREELRAINASLASADISFDPTAYDRQVDVGARQLRRHFTGGFDSGGRHFGGFWENLPKEVRLRGIKIEGEVVIGLDYSQLNPLLAYHLADAEPPDGDAYTLPGFEPYRDGVKKIFNAMLFNHPVRKFPKGSRKLFPRRIKSGDVTGAILLRHPKLKGVLSTRGIGHKLQFLESEIMMGVLHKCLERGIVALPVFDSVIVKASVEGTVTRIMRREFRAVTGLDVKVKLELPRSGTSRILAAEAKHF